MSDTPIHCIAKTRLIDISAAYFMQAGYRASGLSKIALQANIDKSTIYHYFDSKKDIAVHVIKKVSEFYEHSLFALVNKNILNPEDKIMEFIKTLKNLMLDEGMQLIIIPVFAFESIPELVEPIHHHQERWIEVMSNLLSPIYSSYLAEKFARSGWRLIIGTFLDIKIEHSALRRVAIVGELESALKRLWLKEDF